MAFKVDFVRNHGYVGLTLEGPVTRTELEQALDETYAILARNRGDKILLDVMRIEETISMTELYVFVCLSGARMMMDVHVAVLARKEQLRVIGIIENVAQDRGIEFRGFSDQDAALAWLCGERAVRPEPRTA